MECEICGTKVEKAFITQIEGVLLKLCENCSKSGTVLNVIKEQKEVDKKKNRWKDDEEYELVENYGKVIFEARVRMGISTQQLAEKIGEKESLVRKIEREEIRPSDKVVDKLERVLGIKLREKIENFEKSEKSNKSNKEMRLRIADVVRIKD